MGHVRLKTRSLGQTSEKPYVCYRGHIFTEWAFGLLNDIFQGSLSKILIHQLTHGRSYIYPSKPVCSGFTGISLSVRPSVCLLCRGVSVCIQNSGNLVSQTPPSFAAIILKVC